MRNVYNVIYLVGYPRNEYEFDKLVSTVVRAS